ncbi:MAG TPA: hypothetical protein VHR45_24950, partial [Thermoanaerobaculia bacterium]|nr:hypothetical protein [Thermoanaerobaculia bacterium]
IRSLRALRAPGEVGALFAGPIRFTADAEGCTLQTKTTTLRGAWSIVSTLYRMRDFWVIVGSKSISAFVLPVSALDDAGRAFIEARVRSAGGRVR